MVPRAVRSIWTESRLTKLPKFPPAQPICSTGSRMRQNFYRNYLESEILNADPLKLVCLLYRGALERVSEARQCLRRGDIPGRARAISRATAIVNELMLSVSREQGGPLAANLVELYDYVTRSLHDANFRQVDGPLAEAEQ